MLVLIRAKLFSLWKLCWQTSVYREFHSPEELGPWTLLRAGLALGLANPLLLSKSWIGNCL